MKLDKLLTPLQFAVVSYISEKGSLSSSEIRNMLRKKRNYNVSKPSFYTNLSRMEWGGLIEVIGVFDGIRHYSVTDRGFDEAQKTLDFYNNFGN